MATMQDKPVLALSAFALVLALTLLLAAAWGAKIYEGTYTVGTGKDYATLTAAADSIGGKLTGNLTFIVYAPFTNTGAITITDSLKGFALTFTSGNPVYGDFSSENFISSTYGGHFIGASSIGDGGKLIVENLYVKQNKITEAGQYFIYGPTNSTGQLIVRNCIFNGNDSMVGGFLINSTGSVDFLNNVVLNCTVYGIYDNGSARSYLTTTAKIFNNIIYNCRKGVASTNLQYNCFFHNNIVMNNDTFDFGPIANTHGSFNISSDSSARNDRWKNVEQSASIGNDTNIAAATIFKSVAGNTDSCFRLKTEYRSRGVQPYSDYAVKYTDGNYVSDSAADYGAFGFSRPNTLPANRTAIPWLSYGLQSAKYKIVNGSELTPFTITNKNGDTLSYYVDSIAGDTAKCIVNSRKKLHVGDSIYISTNLKAKNNSDGYRAAYKSGFILQNNNTDSTWSWHNLAQPDIIIQDTADSNYAAWPGGKYSIDKSKYFVVYRDCPNNNHGVDSGGYLRLKGFNVDQWSGKLIVPSFKDTIINHYGKRDPRDPTMNVFNIGGVETYVIAFGMCSTIVAAPTYVRQGAYILVSQNQFNTISDSINISGGRATAQRCTPQMLHDDSVIMASYTTTGSDPCSVYIHKASKNNLLAWATTLAFESPTGNIYNESQIIELKTGSIYNGKLCMFVRKESVTYQTPHVSYSYDYGRTWTVPQYYYNVGMPGESATTYPFDVMRLSDDKTIVLLGGQGYSTINKRWGSCWITRDEFVTWDWFPLYWMKYSTLGRYYPSISEYKNGKLFVAWCSNDNGSPSVPSQVFGNYLDINGHLSFADSTYGFTSNFKTGWRPKRTDSTIILGAKYDGKKGLIYQHIDYVGNYQHWNPLPRLAAPMRIEFTARFDSVQFGIRLDSSYVKATAPEYSDRIEAISAGKKITVETATDSIFAETDADGWGVELKNNPAQFANYRIDWLIDTIRIYKNDTLYGTKATTKTLWYGSWFFNLQSDSSTIELKRLVAMPIMPAAVTYAFDTLRFDTLPVDRSINLNVPTIVSGPLTTTDGVKITVGTTLTVGTLSIGGTAGALDTVQSGTPGTQCTLDLGGSTVTASYIYVKDVYVKNGQIKAGSGSINGGNNEGISFGLPKKIFFFFGGGK